MMIASRSAPQRPSMANQRAASVSVLTKTKDEFAGSSCCTIDRSLYRPSSISLLEDGDEKETPVVPDGELAIGSSPRHKQLRSSRRSVQRAASAVVVPSSKPESNAGTEEPDHESSTSPRRCRPRANRSLQRAASVSALGGGGRTRKTARPLLVRTPSKRSLAATSSHRESSRRLSPPSSRAHKSSRVAPRRCASADDALEMLHRLDSLREEDDAIPEGEEEDDDLCSLTSDSSSSMEEDGGDEVVERDAALTEEERAKPKVEEKATRRRPNGRCASGPSPRRKPSARKAPSSSSKGGPPIKSGGSGSKKNGGGGRVVIEERISSLEDELVRARSLIESLQARQPTTTTKKSEHRPASEQEEGSDVDVDDDASAYRVTEISNGGGARKFGKLFGRK